MNAIYPARIYDYGREDYLLTGPNTEKAARDCARYGWKVREHGKGEYVIEDVPPCKLAGILRNHPANSYELW